MGEAERGDAVRTARMETMRERARAACLALPGDMGHPVPESGRSLVVEEASIGGDREDGERVFHMLVESDNIHALGLLQETHGKAVDLVYIDPPYNTGSRDLGYHDKRTHEEWIRFMFPRLVLARELMSPHAIIMVSIDECEVHRLKLLMDCVFGPANRIAGMVWQSRGFMRALISENHEHVLVYALDKSRVVPYWSQTKTPTFFGQAIDRAYSNPDDDPRGPWRDCKCKPPAGKTARRYVGGNHYDYSVNHETGELRRGAVAGDGWIHRIDWEYKDTTMAGHMADGRVVWRKRKDGGMAFAVKRFESEEPPVSCLGSVMTEASMMTARGKEDLMAIGINPGAFNHAKPVRFLEHLLQVAPKDSTVLDFFAGTGTTGHAVMRLNERDGGSRKAILVTSGENGICRNLTWPRLLAARDATGGTGDLVMARVD